MGSPRSYVLRVYRQRTRIAGVAEDIRSGERHAFITMEDLWEWLRRPLASTRRHRQGSRAAPATERGSNR
jgi:hypothetical protein